VFRTFPGLGAGAIQSISTTIVGDIYAPADRARLQGWLSSIWGLAAVIGPVLGAFIVEHLSWAYVFWINLPIGIAAIAVLALFLDEKLTPRQHHIDYLGSALLMLGVGAVMVVVVQAESLDLPIMAALLGFGIVALVLLVVVEARSREPLVPFRLLRNRIIAGGNLGGLSIGAMLTCVVGFLPTYVQGAMGRGAIAGGLVLGAMSVTWAFASIAAGRIMMHTSYRLVAIAGGLALSIGCAMLVALRPADGPLWASAGSLVIGIGMGFCSTVFIVSIQASVPWGQRGAATSSSMFMRFVGQSTGAAACGAVLNATMLHLDPGAAHAVARLLDRSERLAMPPAELAHLTGVMAASLHNAYLLATGFAVLTLLLAFQLPARLSPIRS
jgi:hypothetical protein